MTSKIEPFAQGELTLRKWASNWPYRMPCSTAELTIDEKLQRLRSILAALKSVVVAYSGGVDSTLLLRVARQQLGDKAIAVTAVSPTLPPRELEQATRMAQEMGAQHILVDTDELADPEYAANTTKRCYYCKLLRFGRLLDIAQQKGFSYIVDGCNYDDLGDHRPGMKAAQELGVRSPLIEARLTKAEIRALARGLGIPVWDKPSGACLATRIPYGTPITQERLEQVRDAEQFLHNLGVAQVRVRHHGDIARIEAEPESLPLVMENRWQIASHLRKLGFTYVSADLEGYRSGSMNENLDLKDDG